MRLLNSFYHFLEVQQELKPGDPVYSEPRCCLEMLPGFQTKPKVTAIIEARTYRHRFGGHLIQL